MAGLSEERYKEDIDEAIRVVSEHRKALDIEENKTRLQKMRDRIIKRLSLNSDDKSITTILEFYNDGDGYTLKLPDGTTIGHINVNKNVKAKIIRFNKPENYKKEESKHSLFMLDRGDKVIHKFNYENIKLESKSTEDSNSYLSVAQDIYNLIAKKDYNTLNTDFIIYSLEQMVSNNSSVAPELIDNDKMQVYVSVQTKLRQIMNILANGTDSKKVEYQLEYLYKQICTELINAGFTKLRCDDILKNNH